MDELTRINKAASLGGFAYLVELTTRLYAHRTPALEKYTTEISRSLESKLIAHFGAAINEEQKNKISECRDFRNKLIHSQWWIECTKEDYDSEFLKVKEVVFLLRELTGLSQMKMTEDSPQEIDWSSLDSVEKYIVNVYRDVAVAATAYEIVMRKFAFEFPEMKDIAYNPAKDFEEVQLTLANGLGFSPETRDLVENCRKARNKILHCDFFAAKKIASQIAPGKVKSSGDVIVLRGDQGWKSELVSESTRKGAGAFGWALEGLSSGAATATYDALSIVTRKIYFKDFAVGPKPEGKKETE